MKIQSIISRAAQRNRFAMSMFFVVVVFFIASFERLFLFHFRYAIENYDH